MRTRTLWHLDTVLHHTLDWYINRTLPGWGWLQVQEHRVCQALEERLDTPETVAAERRWTRVNAQARVEGCKCGQPATHVRRMPVTGSVPFEVYTCAEHINVNCWTSRGDGTWVASNQSSYDSPSMRPWAGRVDPIDPV